MSDSNKGQEPNKIVLSDEQFQALLQQVKDLQESGDPNAKERMESILNAVGVAGVASGVAVKETLLGLFALGKKGLGELRKMGQQSDDEKAEDNK